MNPEFQLLDEPWIPLEDHEGHVHQVGLLAAFGEATVWRRIVHPSPLVTAAMYRLLFAIYQRAVSISNLSERVAVWDAGDAHLKAEKYLEAWRHRFDLFDDEAPFWQIPDMTSEHGDMSWAKMAADLNDNNNKVLFDHTRTVGGEGASIATVAQLLVACQMLSVGAGRSRLGYNVNADLATKLVVIPEGETLADTLVANLQPDSEADLPIWEQEPWTVTDILEANTANKTFAWNGTASRITWLTRSIRIMPPDTDGLIRRIAFAAGLRPFEPDSPPFDPWVAYRITDKGELVPRRLELNQAVWRELHSIAIESQKDKWHVAKVMHELEGLDQPDIERELPPAWTVLVAGQAADKAKIEGWGQERWRIPATVLKEGTGRSFYVREFVQDADKLSKTLRKYSINLARDLASKSGDLDKAEMFRLADGMPTERSFWAGLERSFEQVLLILGTDDDTAPDKAEAHWKRAQAEAVARSEDATRATLGKGPTAIRAWAKTGPRFKRTYRELSKHAQQNREKLDEQ